MDAQPTLGAAQLRRPPGDTWEGGSFPAPGSLIRGRRRGHQPEGDPGLSALKHRQGHDPERGGETCSPWQTESDLKKPSIFKHTEPSSNEVELPGDQFTEHTAQSNAARQHTPGARTPSGDTAADLHVGSQARQCHSPLPMHPGAQARVCAHTHHTVTHPRAHTERYISGHGTPALGLAQHNPCPWPPSSRQAV